MNDLDAHLRIPDPEDPESTTSVRVLFENPREEQVYVVGVFRLRDDSEIDFRALPLEVRETILQKCGVEIKKRKQQT